MFFVEGPLAVSSTRYVTFTFFQNIDLNFIRHVISVHILARNHSFAPSPLARNVSLAPMSSHVIREYMETTMSYKLAIQVGEAPGRVGAKGTVVVNLFLSLVAGTMMMKQSWETRKLREV
jgi:hypothetical protein